MWTDRLVPALLIVVGAVNLLPGVVAPAPSRITSVYGVSIHGPGSADPTVLLRHRAVLPALVGIGLLCAAFLPALRVPAVVVGGVSMGSYLLLVCSTPALNGASMRVARVDIAAIALPAVAAFLVSRKSA
ncbi:phosphopantetheine adenylyltransferase [Streptomyces sp. SID3343]|uniref:phosphopantetheine adenylyltransferase n=1 Tax=Streptomyces sp. SID3343 TaxID=2690260 RepID=UPI00137013AF|nr:phosphopantetheine adenylyltransferase [Streptomyces sp. SID3343]MYV96967.1 phosphopantetheine adenylyltransferase [Streptomyces sp. SID3343]